MDTQKRTHGFHDYHGAAVGAVSNACHARKRQIHPLFYQGRDPTTRVFVPSLTNRPVCWRTVHRPNGTKSGRIIVGDIDQAHGY